MDEVGGVGRFHLYITRLQIYDDGQMIVGGKGWG
jgi:hypothetical protein